MTDQRHPFYGHLARLFNAEVSTGIINLRNYCGEDAMTAGQAAILQHYLVTNRRDYLEIPSLKVGERPSVVCRELDIAANGLTGVLLEGIAQVLTHHPVPYTLSVDDNPIGAVGARALARHCLVPRQTHLNLLSIRDCQVNQQGMVELFQSLQRNGTVERLEVAGIILTPATVAHLSDALSVNTSLLSLHMERTRLRDEGCGALARGLEHTRSLAWINIEHCEIGDPGLQHLRRAMENNQAVIQYDLSHNQISSAGLEGLAETLRRQRHPVIFSRRYPLMIWLRENEQFSPESIQALLAGNAENPQSYACVMIDNPLAEESFRSVRNNRVGAAPEP